MINTSYFFDILVTLKSVPVKSNATSKETSKKHIKTSFHTINNPDFTIDFSPLNSVASNFINRQYQPNTYKKILEMIKIFGDGSVNISGLSFQARNVCHNLVKRLMGDKPDLFANAFKELLCSELKQKGQTIPAILEFYINTALDIHRYEEFIFCLFRYHLAANDWIYGSKLTECNKAVIKTARRQISSFNEFLLTTLNSADDRIRSSVAKNIRNNSEIREAFFRVYNQLIVKRVGGCSSRAITDIFQMSECGSLNPYIAFEAAELHLYGAAPSIDNISITPSFEQSSKLYQYAADCGLEVAAWSLGQAYKNYDKFCFNNRKALSPSESIEKQLIWYRKAIEINKDYIPAITSLGNIYLQIASKNKMQDSKLFTQSLNYFKVAAEAGDPYACYNYFRLKTKFSSAKFSPEETINLLQILKCSADYLYSPACYSLAMWLIMQCPQYKDEYDWTLLGMQHSFFTDHHAVVALFSENSSDYSQIAEYYFKLATQNTNNPLIWFDYGRFHSLKTEPKKLEALEATVKCIAISEQYNNIALSLLGYISVLRIAKFVKDTNRYTNMRQEAVQALKKYQNHDNDAIKYARQCLQAELQKSI